MEMPSKAAGALALTVLLLTSHVARAELGAVWAVDDGTKVKQDDLAHPLAAGNGTFDASARTIKLFAARNETVAFQLQLVGGAAATQKVSVSLPSIGPIANSSSDADLDRYFVGRRIELFREHYVKVSKRSKALAWDPGTAAMPAGLTGMLPDALVPLRAADSFTVAAQQNQAVWVDVYVPKDVAPGNYAGALEVRVDGAACTLPACKLTVELQVLSLTLPDAPTAKTMLWFSGSDTDQVLGRFFGSSGGTAAQRQAIQDRHFKLARRHRITLFQGEVDAPDAKIQARITGQAFSAAAGYEGPGQGVGQDMYSIHTYGGTLNAAEAKTWSDFFTQHGPTCEYFLYTMDEPSSGEFSSINAIAQAAKPVPSFVTHAPVSGLNVDIYASYPAEYDIAAAAAKTKAGKRVWIYNGVRPFTGSFVIDDVAVSPRVNPWIQYKYGIPRWFYWESTYYNDFQGGRGQIDVWKNPINFTNKWGDEMNGDGLLFYAGRDKRFPASDQGWDMPLPSIRLKNWRRGIQDVEYLVAAAAAGQKALVDQVVAAILSKAVSETSGGAKVGWPDDGETWLAQRRKLADLFAGTTPPPTDGGVGPKTDGTAPPPHDGSVSSGDGKLPTGGGDEGCGCRLGVNEDTLARSLPLLGLLLLLLWRRRRSDAGR